MTVQAQVLKLAHAVNPVTKRGQRFRGSGSSVAITGAANNGSGLIRITAAGHGLKNNHNCYITGVGGTIEANNTLANPNWPITRISANLFDLVGSAFSNAYISGGTVVGALIGSVGGAKFTAQRLVDVYNEARRLLIERANLNLVPDKRSSILAGNIVKKTDLQFTSGVANKPAGYLYPVQLTDAAGLQIDVLPQELRSDYKDLESAANRFVFDLGTTFEGITAALIPDLSTYVLRYYGITDFGLADVLGNVTVETVIEDLQPALVKLAQLIATEQGSRKINAFADSMLSQFEE